MGWKGFLPKKILSQYPTSYLASKKCNRLMYSEVPTFEVGIFLRCEKMDFFEPLHDYILFVRQSYLGIDATVQVVEAPKYRVSCIRNTDRYESSTHFALSWLVSCNGMHDYERCQNF